MNDNQRLLGRLIANQEVLLKTVEKLEQKIDAQAAEIQALKTTITTLRAGGRVLLWVSGVLGSAAGAIGLWTWRFWQASQT